eukprot:TRINITY_DN2281_c1_g1_i5.p1 TRINITY_DN2281_c1_g1~~TRINITY_DN2281_c1_g1_i5.p1  ORF type:complete len:223 (-),score=-18.54 TRINITY_DN2281_c1_g1_i5:20-655(-)
MRTSAVADSVVGLAGARSSHDHKQHNNKIGRHKSKYSHRSTQCTPIIKKSKQIRKHVYVIPCRKYQKLLNQLVTFRYDPNLQFMPSKYNKDQINTQIVSLLKLISFTVKYNTCINLTYCILLHISLYYNVLDNLLQFTVYNYQLLPYDNLILSIYMQLIFLNFVQVLCKNIATVLHNQKIYMQIKINFNKFFRNNYATTMTLMNSKVQASA